MFPVVNTFQMHSLLSKIWCIGAQLFSTVSYGIFHENFKKGPKMKFCMIKIAPVALIIWFLGKPPTKNRFWANLMVERQVFMSKSNVFAEQTCF